MIDWGLLLISGVLIGTGLGFLLCRAMNFNASLGKYNSINDVRDQEAPDFYANTSNPHQLSHFQGDDGRMVFIVNKALNGRVIEYSQIINVKNTNQSFGGKEMKLGIYIVNEEEKVSDAIAKLVLLGKDDDE